MVMVMMVYMQASAVEQFDETLAGMAERLDALHARHKHSVGRSVCLSVGLSSISPQTNNVHSTARNYIYCVGQKSKLMHCDRRFKG